VDDSVTVTAAHSVAYGREAEFFAWVNSLLLRAEESGDFLGGGLLGPPEAGGEWHVIYRWMDQDSADWWDEYVDRAGWMRGAEDFSRPVEIQETTGLRTWFEKRAGAPNPPPKWKMALVTLTAVFPPVLLFNATLTPRLLGLPTVLRTLVFCIGVTSAVTWVMMPRLMPLFRGWLNRSSHRPTGRHAASGRAQGPPPTAFGRERRPAPGNGRPMLNLVRDDQFAGSRPYPPSSRDPRSSYLRRETG
jgi:antibiotic biosynthesis monooxygenase (ABM) superfamily enzyme